MQEFFNEWGGVVAAVLIGVLVPVFTKYYSTRNTIGPKERAFLVKDSVWTGVGTVVFLGLLIGLGYALPQPYKRWTFWLMMLLFGLALVISTLICNRRQAQIRAEESQEGRGK